MIKWKSVSKVRMTEKMRQITGIILTLVLIMVMAGCGSNRSEQSDETNYQQSDGSSQQDVNQNDIDNADSGGNESGSYQEILEGDTAPDFTAELSDGSIFTLSEQSGKVVLLNFWATWCGPCVGEMPAFEKLHKEYGDEVVILAVNCLEDKDTVDRFISDNGYTFPIAYDEEGSINMKYPTDGIPYTLVIGIDGSVHKIYVGAADADTQYQEYKSAIDTVLGR